MKVPSFMCKRRDGSELIVSQSGRVLVITASILIGPRGQFEFGSATLGKREARELAKFLNYWAGKP